MIRALWWTTTVVWQKATVKCWLISRLKLITSLQSPKVINEIFSSSVTRIILFFFCPSIPLLGFRLYAAGVSKFIKVNNFVRGKIVQFTSRNSKILKNHARRSVCRSIKWQKSDLKIEINYAWKPRLINNFTIGTLEIFSFTNLTFRK